MSARRCREANGGKFTRPREQWTGKRRRRAGGVLPYVPAMSQVNKAASAAAAGVARDFGRLRFKQKTG